MTSAEPRIAHVNVIAQPSRWPGLVAKLADQAAAAREAGVPLDVFTVAAGPGGRVGPRATAIELAVPLSDYCAVVLRYQGGVDPSLLLRRPGGLPMVAEYHTDQTRELRAVAGAGWRGAAAWAAERCCAGAILRRCRGAVAVTDELAGVLRTRHEVARVATIGNGVRVASIPHSGFRPPGAAPAELVFACGAFEPWQGLDLLLAALTVLERPVVLHLLGRLSAAQRSAIERLHPRLPDATRIVVHGVVDRAAADAIYRGASLGVSSLALRRKGMRQACPLKSREYLARGLPYIAAYDDPDLPADLLGVRRVEASDPRGLAEGIARALVEVPVGAAETMRRFAECELDWKVKMSRLYTFVMRCL